MIKDHQISMVLADDDEDDRNFFTMAVRNTSPAIRLTAVNDGVNFMDYLESNPNPKPNLVILDISMPRLSGLECLKQIRESENWKDLPVIIYSTSSNEDDLIEATRNGANLYVVKPKEISALYRLVNYLVTLDWKRRRPYATDILFKDFSVI